MIGPCPPVVHSSVSCPGAPDLTGSVYQVVSPADGPYHGDRANGEPTIMSWVITRSVVAVGWCNDVGRAALVGYAAQAGRASLAPVFGLPPTIRSNACARCRTPRSSM